MGGRCGSRLLLWWGRWGRPPIQCQPQSPDPPTQWQPTTPPPPPQWQPAAPPAPQPPQGAAGGGGGPLTGLAALVLSDATLQAFATALQCIVTARVVSALSSSSPAATWRKVAHLYLLHLRFTCGVAGDSDLPPIWEAVDQGRWISDTSSPGTAVEKIFHHRGGDTRVQVCYDAHLPALSLWDTDISRYILAGTVLQTLHSAVLCKN